MSATAFYKAQPVIEFMCEVLDIRNIDEQPKPLTDSQRVRFTKEIKGRDPGERWGPIPSQALAQTLTVACLPPSPCSEVWGTGVAHLKCLLGHHCLPHALHRASASIPSLQAVNYLREILMVSQGSLAKGNFSLLSSDSAVSPCLASGLKVEVTHCGQMKRKYRVCNVTRRPASHQT